MREVPLPLESVVVYPKEPSRDDFATALAAKAEAVEVDHCRYEYFQSPQLHFDHFLFIKYIIQSKYACQI